MIDTVRTPLLTVLGLDLGKRRDWTALAIAQAFLVDLPLPDDQEKTRKQIAWDIPFLDRVQNQSYEVIADRVAALKNRPEHKHSLLVIDETGVGTAVGDMLVARKLRPHRVTITGGIQVASEGLTHHVPKRDLATIVGVMLESKRLRIAKELPLASVLTAELEGFQVKISLSGHDSYGAGEDWRENNHDDLVLAVALALWLGDRRAKVQAATPATGVWQQSWTNTN